MVCTISGTQSFDIDREEVELEADNDTQVRERQRKIMILDRSRLLSKHAGALVYYDSRHRVYQAPLCGGFIGELVQELQPDGMFRDQLLTIRGPSGEHCLIEYYPLKTKT